MSIRVVHRVALVHARLRLKHAFHAIIRKVERLPLGPLLLLRVLLTICNAEAALAVQVLAEESQPILLHLGGSPQPIIYILFEQLLRIVRRHLRLLVALLW